MKSSESQLFKLQKALSDKYSENQKARWNNCEKNKKRRIKNGSQEEILAKWKSEFITKGEQKLMKVIRKRT